MSNSYKHVGEQVNITFSSTDATTAAAVVLKDSANNTRTLAANEILLLDSLGGVAELTGTNVARVFNDVNSDGSVAAGELIGGFGPGTFALGFPADGYSCKMGITPLIKATQAAAIDAAGVGRIIKGSGGSTRPSYLQSMVPGQ